MKTKSDSSKHLMQENIFWRLIKKSRIAANGNYQKQILSLKKILLTLDAKEIETFANTFTALLVASYDWKLWGAAQVVNGFCSDDSFHYFRQYLIGHGKNKFYKTLKDPDSCVSWIKSQKEVTWEGLQYSALDAYEQKTGKDIPNSYRPKFKLKGRPFTEASLFKNYPKLIRKFYR